MDETQLDELRDRVRVAAANPSFRHAEWFVTWHLEVMERLALELLERFPEADRDTVLALVWLHDYGKIIDFDHQYETSLREGAALMADLGIDDAFARRVIQMIQTIDRNLEIDLREAEIEVRIASSADAASHWFGPFMQLYWYENPEMTIPDLIESNKAKIAKDWDRKMVLPEVCEALERKHQFLLEQAGELPDRLLG